MTHSSAAYEQTISTTVLPRQSITEQVNQYRTERRRRKQTTLARRQERSRSERDAILDLARIWAPYGRPPSETIFVLFGITPCDFAERVQQALRTSESDTSVVVGLQAVYSEPALGHKP